MTTVRRVVTGYDERGRSVVVQDARVEVTAITGSMARVHRIWGADGVDQLPGAGSEPPHVAFFPPVGGYRFILFTLLPAGSPPQEDGGVRFPDFVEAMQRGPGRGIHASDSVDLIYVVAGEIWLELDDAAEVRLVAGDTAVQNGTVHGWRNRSDSPATLALVLVGARRAESAP
jgi:Cupin domain